MKNLKLVFLCNCNHELFETDAQREAFYSFVENGGGLLATHSSSACERGSKRFKDFLGGAFYTHHPQFPVPFDGIDRSHPAFAAFPEGYVWAKDEIYINHKGMDAADIQGIRPLLTMDWKASKGYKEGDPAKYILAWCKTFGKGRIFYTALGHNPSDWGKMEWQLHLLEAARWAMGELPDSLATPSSAAFSRATIDGAECVKGGKVLWKLNLANRESKPFVHPLCLPDGRCLTDARTKDHPWHLGLWFCWKYINGVNYWEPRDPAQSNLFPDGMTCIRNFGVEPKAGGACDAWIDLWYGPRAQPGRVLLDERRKMSFSAPAADGSYTMRSKHLFTTREKVVLDARRPVAYGGFSLRMDPMVRGFRMEGVGGSPSADKNVGGPKGMTAVRLVDPANGHGVEVKMLAPLAGERIYTWSDHCFVNPMPLYEQPISLEPGETVSLDYEVKVF